ncbi:MAG: class II fructose-bisphosphatase [Planctomycetaceae bacterium]
MNKAAASSRQDSHLTPVNDAERNIEFEFIRATENAALSVVHWLGRGDKERADAAACDAIYGVFDFVEIRGEVVIGEGVKDNAPGIFVGEKLGRWSPGSPRFDIALDPIDGTTNLANGLPNSISVIAASHVENDDGHVLRHIPSFYSRKLAFGPAVVQAVRNGMEPIGLHDPLEKTLPKLAEALGKRVPELVVVMLNRPRHNELIATVRRCGAALRLISDGDITAAVAPSLPDSGVDVYCGIGGSPEGILTAAALKTLGGDMQLQMWPRDDAERAELLKSNTQAHLDRIYTLPELVRGDSAVFCATGISDSSLLPGVKLVGSKAITHSILMRARSRTVRYIRAVHDLAAKTIHLRSDHSEHKL